MKGENPMKFVNCVKHTWGPWGGSEPRNFGETLEGTYKVESGIGSIFIPQT
jgi:hypothetical protein